MKIIYYLFQYTGLTGSTKNPTYQIIINSLYTFLTFYAICIPFIVPNLYGIDSKIILAFYILIVYFVYITTVQYFKTTKDNVICLSFENDCTSSQLCKLKFAIGFFITMGFYCLIGIPINFYFYIIKQNPDEIKNIIYAIWLGIFWLCFYFVCCSFFSYIIMFCMGQTTVIKKWLKGLKKKTIAYDIDSIYQMYKHFYKTSKLFNKIWINTILLMFVVISFRIPISFVLVSYANFYFEIVLLLFNIYAWFQLLIPICELNQQNECFQTYFYKHPNIIQNRQLIDEIVQYNSIRMLGLNIYGFIPKFSHLLSVVIILLNVVIPVFASFLISKIY